MRLTWHILGLAAALAAVAVPAAAETYGSATASGVVQIADQDVRVQRRDDALSVDVVMRAPVAPDIAWDVLVDFEQMPRYQRQLKTSEVLERSADRLLVRQTGVAGFGPFTNAFESVRELKLSTAPRRIRARQVSGNSLKAMTSLMTVEPASGGTRLTYHADMELALALPPLVGPAAVRHETAQQFSALINEMIRRQQLRVRQ